MKKAKIMLIGIAVLAMAAGMLAFRVSNLSNRVFCYTTVFNGANPMCDVALPMATVSYQLGAFVAYYVPVHHMDECDGGGLPCSYEGLITTSDD